MKKFKVQLDTKKANEKRSSAAKAEVEKSKGKTLKRCPNCTNGKVAGHDCIACGGFGNRTQ